MDASLDEHGREAKRPRQEGEFGHRWVWGLLAAGQVAQVLVFKRQTWPGVCHLLSSDVKAAQS
jgi:hypothetical protein